MRDAEVERAEVDWIKDTQWSLKSNPDYSKFAKQLGIQSKDEILICHGRLENAEIELGAKYPIILQKFHRFTDLVILDCHEKVHHLRVNATLAELRSRYWVTQGRQYVKRLLNTCFICRKLEGKSYNAPNVAPLPDFRVNEAPPFSKIGVDFAGPLYCKGSRGSTTKAYITLFTCCVTRAVHLGLTQDLHATSFLNALK